MTKVLLSVVLLACIVPSQATVVEPLNLQQMCDQANSAFHGTCVSTQPHWSNDHRLILTTYEFRVTEWLKRGDGAATVFVTHVGGLLDGKGTHVAGMPEYKVGDELVLFLNEPHPTTGCCVPMGMAQGVYHVKDGTDGGKTIYRSYAGLVFWNPTTRSATQPPEEQKGEQPLADFLSSVRTKVANPTER